MVRGQLWRAGLLPDEPPVWPGRTVVVCAIDGFTLRVSANAVGRPAPRCSDDRLRWIEVPADPRGGLTACESAHVAAGRPDAVPFRTLLHRDSPPGYRREMSATLGAPHASELAHSAPLLFLGPVVQVTEQLAISPREVDVLFCSLLQSKFFYEMIRELVHGSYDRSSVASTGQIVSLRDGTSWACGAGMRDRCRAKHGGSPGYETDGAVPESVAGVPDFIARVALCGVRRRHVDPDGSRVPVGLASGDDDERADAGARNRRGAGR